MLLRSRASAAPATPMEPIAESSANASVKALLAESRSNLDQVRQSAQAFTPVIGLAADAGPAMPGLAEAADAGDVTPAIAAPVRSAAVPAAPSRPAVSASSSGFGSSRSTAQSGVALVSAPSASPRPASAASARQSARGALTSGPSLGTIAAALSTTGKPESIYRVTVEEKVVAFTFDDGPSIGKTRRLMEFLESRKTPATFFFIGRQVEQYPEIVREAERRGFELANHTQTHVDARRASLDTIRREIDDCQSAFSAAGVAPPSLIRFPYGNSTAAARGYCHSIGLAMMAWDVDTRDWEPTATADKIVAKVMKETGPGSIILMHERPDATFQALPRILDFLDREGYRVVTAGDLLRAAHAER